MNITKRVPYPIVVCFYVIIFSLLAWVLFDDLIFVALVAVCTTLAGIVTPGFVRDYRQAYLREMSEKYGPPESRIDNEYDGYDEYGDDDDDVSDSYTSYSEDE